MSVPSPLFARVASTPHPIAKPEAHQLAPGTLLGGAYLLGRCLGRGGMGDVHVATHPQMPGEVVVKVLSPDIVVNNEEATARFRTEAMVMASIHHPNVIRLLDFNFTTDGRPYLVMEYLPGENLAEVLTTKTFSVAEVSEIVRQVASALDAAHKLGIVHRDLKPENLMVVPRAGRAPLIKVIDFGICKARNLNHVTSKGMVMGTPEFMSPEQAEGRHEDVEAPSDQFALAVITYLLMSARLPWTATTPVEFLHCVANQYPLALTDDGKYRALEAVLFRAMAKSPEDRYPSILAYSEALDRALVEEGLLPIQLRIKKKSSPDASLKHAEVPLEAVLEVPRRRGARVGLAAMALMVLMFGAYLTAVGAPTIRTRASAGWNTLRSIAAVRANRGALRSHRLISKASQDARAYLSLGTSP